MEEEKENLKERLKERWEKRKTERREEAELKKETKGEAEKQYKATYREALRNEMLRRARANATERAKKQAMGYGERFISGLRAYAKEKVGGASRRGRSGRISRRGRQARQSYQGRGVYQGTNRRIRSIPDIHFGEIRLPDVRSQPDLVASSNRVSGVALFGSRPAQPFQKKKKAFNMRDYL